MHESLIKADAHRRVNVMYVANEEVQLLTIIPHAIEFRREGPDRKEQWVLCATDVVLNVPLTLLMNRIRSWYAE